MKSMSVRITSAVIALIMIACVFSSCKSKKGGDEEITRSNQVIAGPVTTAENGEATTGEETTGVFVSALYARPRQRQKLHPR